MYRSIDIEISGLGEESTEALSRAVFRWFSEREMDVDVGGGYTLGLKIVKEMSEDGFCVQNGDGHTVITASDTSAIFAGAGTFLRSCRFENGSFEPTLPDGASIPQKRLRGIYLSTHFYNFYHSAPLEQVESYVEELSLWGYNTLALWFDMHHYTSMEVPAASEMVKRLKAIICAAKRAGMRVGLGFLANESFAGSPENMRADWTSGHNGYTSDLQGHYHVEICPSKPNGLDLILKYREDVLRAFAEIDLDYVWIWPYDQGGCTCSDCRPWGANGFLRTAQAVTSLTQKYFRNAKIVLSCWNFDAFTHGEWDAFKEAFSNEPHWVDYLLVEPREKYDSLPVVKGELFGLPVIGFPEISMAYCTPWGGFGANPLPKYLSHIWSVASKVQEGGFPYSEGIFEDINKFIFSRFYWDGGIDSFTALREYASAYFSFCFAGEIAETLQRMEHTLLRVRCQPDGTPQYYLENQNEYDIPGVKYVISSPEDIEKIASDISKIDSCLPEHVRKSWRWRLIVLRSMIDRSLAHNEWLSDADCYKAYGELIKIYYAQNADWTVRPPVTR
jgi:hypothetical protein